MSFRVLTVGSTECNKSDPKTATRSSNFDETERGLLQLTRDLNDCDIGGTSKLLQTSIYVTWGCVVVDVLNMIYAS